MRDLRRLLKYLRPHWPIFTLAILAMLLVGLLESAIGGLIVPIFDQAFVQGAGQRTAHNFRSATFNSPGAPRRLENDLGIADCFHVHQRHRRVFSTYLMARIGQSAVLKLRQDLYSHLLAQSATFFEKTPHQLSRFETCLERGGNRDGGDQHDSRHAARKFHLDRLSVSILLLQLAAHARFAGDRAGDCLPDCEVWSRPSQSRTREF